MKVILASASPRRQALLQQIGITPLVCPADFAEGSGTASQAQEVALYNAAGKCAAVAAKMGDELPIIAADTIVVIDNVIWANRRMQQLPRLCCSACPDVHIR